MFMLICVWMDVAKCTAMADSAHFWVILLANDLLLNWRPQHRVLYHLLVYTSILITQSHNITSSIISTYIDNTDYFPLVPVPIPIIVQYSIVSLVLLCLAQPKQYQSPSPPPDPPLAHSHAFIVLFCCFFWSMQCSKAGNGPIGMRVR